MKMFFYLFLLLVMSVCSACWPGFYTPPPQNIATLSKKGDANIGLGFGARGLNAQCAIALSDRYMMLANLRYDQQKKHYFDFFAPPPPSITHHQHTAELGLGRYGRFGAKKSGIWSVALGYGLGKTVESSPESGSSEQVSSPYKRAFLQTAIGVCNPRFELILSCQPSWFEIGRVRSGNQELHGRYFSGYTVEPAFTIGIGHKNFKFFLQVAKTIGSADYYLIDESSLVNGRDGNFSMGLKGLIDQ